jgi:hypothetical protein
MRRSTAIVAAAASALALAGCGAAATAQNAADTNSSSSSAMSGMNMSGASGSGAAVSAPSLTAKQTKAADTGAVSAPLPTRTIATGLWKDMSIVAQERTPVPFYVDNGTKFTEVKPTKKSSFHLMVMLSDRHTGVAIPYANVWAEITKNGKTVFNERQWPMLSEYMGPHYGNDVSLPGPGTYHLTLLVSAPEAAMHVEYAHMWSGTHKVTSTFTWQ